MKNRIIKPVIFSLLMIVSALTIPCFNGGIAISSKMSLLGAIEMPIFIQKFVASAHEWFISLGIKNPDKVLMVLAVLCCLILIVIIVMVIVIFVKIRGYNSAKVINKKELEIIRKEKRERDALVRKAQKEKNRKIKNGEILLDETVEKNEVKPLTKKEQQKLEKEKARLEKEKEKAELEAKLLEEDRLKCEKDAAEKLAEAERKAEEKRLADEKRQNDKLTANEFDIDEDLFGGLDIELSNETKNVAEQSSEFDFETEQSFNAPINDDLGEFIVSKAETKDNNVIDKATLADDEVGIIADIKQKNYIEDSSLAELSNDSDLSEFVVDMPLYKEDKQEQSSVPELLDLSSFDEPKEILPSEQTVDIIDFSTISAEDEESEINEDTLNYVEKEIVEQIAEPTLDFENIEQLDIPAVTPHKESSSYKITPEMVKLMAKIEKESLKQKNSTEEITEKIFGGKKIYIDRDSVILPKCFESMLMQADDGLKQIYDRLKNELLSYDDVHSRMITGFEVFRRGCAQARFAIKGKTLYVYLRIDPASVGDDIVKIKDYSDKKALEDTPTEIRVSGKKKINICVDIISAMFGAQDIEKNGEYVFEKFSDDYPYVVKGVIYSNNLLYKDE